MNRDIRPPCGQTMAMILTRYNDLVLAALVVAIIALIILPLPLFLVDGLIAVNMGIAVSLLMISMYISSPLSLSTFPNLLLFTTLFRLALNITTTRLILLQADAGKIIETFGNFVVAGNFIVGGVVFLIITIVQFLVIAKGSERVAEVAARFTLDAMPGKQMSIDADLRAGGIDMDEARRRRTAVEKESQLYGAMDGAMKFVKGDAIAGLIVTVINILGGVLIGTLQKGMPAGKAVQTYSVLTIGDGLISQIPALFISITAGIMVTRVSTDESVHLGGDIGSQVLSQPKALLVGGGILLAFALIPGFPKFQFILLGLTVAGIGTIFFRLNKKSAQGDGPDLKALTSADRGAVKEEEKQDFSITVPLLIDMAATAREFVSEDLLNEELIRIRKALYQDLGVPFPGIHLRFDENMADKTYVVKIREIPVAQGRFEPGKLLATESVENLDLLNIPYETDTRFLPDLPTLWVDDAQKEKLVETGVHFMETYRILTYHLSYVLKKYSDEFIGLQESRFLLDSMEGQYPELVREVLRILPIQKITEVFQRLVQEGISIRDLRTILQYLIEWGQKEKDVILLSEYVRTALKRYISHKYSHGQNILAAILMETEVEETIRKAVRQTSAGSFLALDPATAKRFVEKIKAEAGDMGKQPKTPVLLASMDIRRYVKKLIEAELADLPVLSFQELTQEVTVQPIGKILLD